MYTKHETPNADSGALDEDELQAAFDEFGLRLTAEEVPCCL